MILIKGRTCSRHTRVIPGSFRLIKPTQPQTSIIVEPQCSQGIVYPRYTYNSSYAIISKCHYNQCTLHTLPHNETEELFPPIITTPCQSQSKIVMRPLSTMGENTYTLESMISYYYPPLIIDKI